MPARPPESAKPLLVRLRNWVGDVVLGLPALQMLTEQGHALQLMGPRWAADLLAGYDWPLHPHPGTLRTRVAAWQQLRQQAQGVDEGFDRRLNTLVLTHSFSSALETRLAGLRTLGYATDGRRLLLGQAQAFNPQRHALQIYWDLACRFTGQALPLPQRIGLRTTTDHQAQADALLARSRVRPGFIVVCPFTGGLYDRQDKAWPQFPAYVRGLQELGRDVLVCPGPGEEEAAAWLYPGATALPHLGLGTYGGVLRRAALVVANDTGPAHLAAAVDAPVLSVLGPTPPDLWAPWGPWVDVVRHWPRWPSPKEVLDATERKLAGSPLVQRPAAERPATMAAPMARPPARQALRAQPW